MKKEVSPVVIGVAAVALLGVIGLAAFKFFGGDPAAKTATPEQVKAVGAMRGAIMSGNVHRDENGHFVDAQGNPVNLSAAPTKGSR